MSGLPRRKTSRVRRWTGLGGLVLLGVGLFFGLEALLMPWARSLTGAPTLTGAWMGQFVTPAGRTVAISIELMRSLPGRNCAKCPRLLGIAHVCNDGQLQVYRLSGDVEDWRGRQFRLSTHEQPEDRVRPVLGALRGHWQQDHLLLATSLLVRGAPGTKRVERDAHGREQTQRLGGHPEGDQEIRWSMQRSASPLPRCVQS